MRFPPAMVPIAEGVYDQISVRVESHFPVTDEGDWCGEYQKSEEKAGGLHN